MNLHIAKLQKCYNVVNDNIENICVGLLNPIGFWDSVGVEPSTKARGDFPKVSMSSLIETLIPPLLYKCGIDYNGTNPPNPPPIT